MVTDRLDQIRTELNSKNSAQLSEHEKNIVKLIGNIDKAEQVIHQSYTSGEKRLLTEMILQPSSSNTLCKICGITLK